MASVAIPKQDPKQVESSKTNKRVDWKKQKELEEARKAGTAPPEVDEEGKDINPHIPQYITSVPWYLGENRPTLKHQRVQPSQKKEFAGLDDYYKKGLKSKVATKFRKGACENCGAMTHKKKDCLERPRKVGARFTGEDIQPDELLPGELNFDYDGKRDRWAGYDVSVHKKVLDEYAKVDEAKRQLKASKLEEELEAGKADVKLMNKDDDEEEEKYADEIDMPGQKFDSNVRQTVRNLRIREDTAKYLYNLDPSSAYYDPKTRAMRGNPFDKTGADKGKMVNYYGDNFARASGEVKDIANAQLFAWEAYERGADVHLQSDPTKLELLHKTYEVKKEGFKKEIKGGILEKYGGAEHLDAPPKELLLAQTEEYVEYSRTGKVVKGQEKAVMKSKYEEDVYINNHTSVFGSFWEDFKWGYSCCHSFIKQSYCTGEAGKLANKKEMPLEITTQSKSEESHDSKKSLVELHKEKMAEKPKESKKSKTNDSDIEAKKARLKKALEEEDERQRTMDKVLQIDERKRSYNSLNISVKEPTEEEMEAYRLKKARYEDPMAHFSSKS